MKLLTSLAILTGLVLSCASSHAAATGNEPIANAGSDRPDTTSGEAPITLAASGSASVTIDGSGSYDPNNLPLTLSWNVSPNPLTTPLTGQFPTFTFSAAGSYTITVTATNTLGLSSTDSAVITVSADTCAPVLVTPASNKAVECDGTGNNAELAAWLANHGGAVVTDDCGPVTWSSNFVEATSWQFGICPVEEQATVTFKATDGGGNFVTTTATFQIKDTTAPPLNWTVNGSPVADYCILTVPCTFPLTVKVLPNDLCSASVLQKSYAFLQGSGSVSYSSSTGGTVNDTVTLNSGSNNARVRFYFKATDDCGNSSATEWIEIDVDKKCATMKGNEGVGNGVDPDTPGALHNGNNDAPGTYPGNPGARHKKL